MRQSHHLRRLSARDRELQVGILLPVPEQQRVLGQKAVVDAPHGRNGLRVGVAVDAALEVLRGADELLPRIEVVRIFGLATRSIVRHGGSRETPGERIYIPAYHFGVQLLQFRILLLRSSVVILSHGGSGRGLTQNGRSSGRVGTQRAGGWGRGEISSAQESEMKTRERRESERDGRPSQPLGGVELLLLRGRARPSPTRFSGSGAEHREFLNVAEKTWSSLGAEKTP